MEPYLAKPSGILVEPSWNRTSNQPRPLVEPWWNPQPDHPASLEEIGGTLVEPSSLVETWWNPRGTLPQTTRTTPQPVPQTARTTATLEEIGGIWWNPRANHPRPPRSPWWNPGGNLADGVVEPCPHRTLVEPYLAPNHPGASLG